MQSEGDRDHRRPGTDRDHRIAVTDVEALRYSAQRWNKISGAVGLVQFTVPAERQLGATKQKSPPPMAAVARPDQVEMHFQPHGGSLQTVEGATYVAVLWSVAVGKDD